MEKKAILALLEEWSIEFNETLTKGDSFCIALFSTKKELLFSNEAFNSLVNNNSSQLFINPTFDQLLALEHTNNLIFDGFLTLGDYFSVNTSIVAQVYRKQEKLLVIGGINTTQLVEQNEIMHQLNREISNLQRDLIKKTHTLENTLAQLNTANLELSKLNSDKDLFMQILAHDLRSPFNSLLGFSNLLLENIRVYDIDKIEKQVQVINKQSYQTFNLLEDLLLWSKSQSGKLPFVPEEIVFIDVCNNIIDSYSENKKMIYINCFEVEKTVLSVDLQMFKTILRNLISNALKYTNINGRINVFAEKKQNNTIITISDNGIGIKEEDQKKLWDLTKNHTTLGSEGEKGSGFGLMLCKEFVEKHGGKIWVESEFGKGCDFKFTIPYKQ